MKPLASASIRAARKGARERYLAGLGDKEAANRYRLLAASGNFSRDVAREYLRRAAECDRLAGERMRSTMGGRAA